MTAADPLTLRDRLLAATYTCVARFGLGKTTIEDVVKESGVSRATIYRQFPGGRDELLLETVGWELGQLLHRARRPRARRARPRRAARARASCSRTGRCSEHVVLRKILDTEPERLLPLLTDGVGEDAAVHRRLPACRTSCARPTPAGCAPASTSSGAAEYLARGILSLISAPGRWDLEDPAQVRDLVARRAPRRHRALEDACLFG